MAFFDGFSLKTAFSLYRGKNRISQGVENRGLLIGVPLALRENDYRINSKTISVR